MVFIVYYVPTFVLSEHRMIPGLAFTRDRQSRELLFFSGINEELSFLGKDDQVRLRFEALSLNLPFGLKFCAYEFWLIVIEYIYY